MAVIIGAIVITAVISASFFLTGDILFGAFAVGGIIICVIAYTRPDWALALWLCSICFLPYWAGVRFSGYWPPSAIVGLVVLAGVLLRGNFEIKKVNPWDIAVLTFAAACILLGIADVSQKGHIFISVTQWACAYLIGRVFAQEIGLDYIYRAVAIIFTIVGVFAILEFATGINLYSLVAPGEGAQGLTLNTDAQLRGGQMRVEFAFGHSIALANSLAMAVPLTLAARLPVAVKVASITIISFAVLFTISRSGMVTLVLAVALSVWAIRDNRLTTGAKATIAAAGALAAYFAAPWLSGVLTRASDEAGRSGRYREDLLQMFPQTEAFGLADGYAEDGRGKFLWHGMESIDNAFLRIAVNFGWVPMLLVLAIFIAAVVLTLLRRATPAVVALAAITPAIFTVALIVQLGSVVFFFVGLAAAGVVAERRHRTDAARELVGAR